MSSTLSDSQPASNAAGQPFIPFNIDKDPIRWEGNPAHLEGALFEVAECFNRTGKFMTLLEEGSVLLSNGATVVDSVSAVQFASGVAVDPVVYGFSRPCPDTPNRIQDYDAEATLASTPTFAAAGLAITAVPAGLVKQYLVSRLVIKREDRALMESILSIVVDSDIAAELIELCKGSGRSLIALMYKRALTAKPPDKALVIKTYDSYMIHGLLGEVNLASFNSFYKEHTKLLRTMPPAERAARGSDATIMQMLNNTMMSSIEHRKQFQLILIAEPPSTMAQS